MNKNGGGLSNEDYFTGWNEKIFDFSYEQSIVYVLPMTI